MNDTENNDVNEDLLAGGRTERLRSKQDGVI